MNKHPTKPSTGRSKMEGVGTSGDHGNQVTDQEQKMYAPRDNSTLNFVDASILSKLELPTFDGNILDYPEFFARFTTLVGSKIQLDDTTKFSLLKSCLRGRALQSIQGLSMTPGNYKIALDILATHYDDKVTMKHIIYTKLSQLPSCDPEGRNLQSLYNQMFALVRQLTDGQDDSSETGLGAILLNKLPARVRSQIYGKTSNSHNLSPSELLHLLTDIVRKEATLFEIDYHARSNHFTPFYSSTDGFLAVPRSVPQGSPPDAMSRPKMCPYCKNPNHRSFTCDAFPTPNERSRQAKRLHLCYNCLSSQHTLSDCVSKQYCKFCARRHHSSLCSAQSSYEGERSKGRTLPHQGIPHQTETYQHKAATATNKTDPTCHSAKSDTIRITRSLPPTTTKRLPTQATLMCTPVRLFNPSRTSKTTIVTAFFDSGSSQSYITDDVVERLALPNLSSEHISVSTFGTTALLQLQSRNHIIGISTEKGDRKLHVKSLPTLTAQLRHAHTVPDSQSDDVTISSCRPSILIGNDYFWDMVLSDDFYYEILPNGYRLLHTTLGNIVVGKTLNIRNIPTHTTLGNIVVGHAFNLETKTTHTTPCANDKRSKPMHQDDLSNLVHNLWKSDKEQITDDSAQEDDDADDGDAYLQFFNNTRSNPSHSPDNFLRSTDKKATPTKKKGLLMKPFSSSKRNESARISATPIHTRPIAELLMNSKARSPIKKREPPSESENAVRSLPTKLRSESCIPKVENEQKLETTSTMETKKETTITKPLTISKVISSKESYVEAKRTEPNTKSSTLSTNKVHVKRPKKPKSEHSAVKSPAPSKKHCSITPDTVYIKPYTRKQGKFQSCNRHEIEIATSPLLPRRPIEVSDLHVKA